MSDSVSTSDTSSRSGEEGGRIMFKCKKCEGDKLFKASEKDAHKLWHQAQKQTRKGRSQELPTPSGSQATSMFEQAASPAKSKKKPAGKTGKIRKIRSPKVFNSMGMEKDYHRIAGGEYTGQMQKQKKIRLIRSDKVYNKDHEMVYLVGTGQIKGV